MLTEKDPIYLEEALKAMPNIILSILSLMAIVLTLMAIVLTGCIIYSKLKLIQHHTDNILSLHKELEKQNDKIEILKKSIQHIYLLLDIVGNGLCSDAHKTLFQKVIALGPEKLPRTQKDLMDLSHEISLENFMRARAELLNMIRATEDPDQKEIFKTHLKEIETIMNLLDTIDENSSEDYKMQVMVELRESLIKIARKDIF